MPTFHQIEDAPQQVGPFCHASEQDGWVMLTGQMPTYPGEPDRSLADSIEDQTIRVIENLKIVLSGLGLGLEHVLQCRCYLTRFEQDFDAFNEVYKTYFDDTKRPARTTIGVTALAVGALVEIDMVAKRP